MSKQAFVVWEYMFQSIVGACSLTPDSTSGWQLIDKRQIMCCLKHGADLLKVKRHQTLRLCAVKLTPNFCTHALARFAAALFMTYLTRASNGHDDAEANLDTRNIS